MLDKKLERSLKIIVQNKHRDERARKFIEEVKALGEQNKSTAK